MFQCVAEGKECRNTWEIVALGLANPCRQEEKVMLKLVLVAGVLAAQFAGPPSLAQQVPPPAAEAQPPLVGLAIYSSDGHKLGQVTQVGTASGQPAVRAELGGFLDVAPSAVVIPVSLFEQKSDRIELALTAEEVRATLSKQRDSSSSKVEAPAPEHSGWASRDALEVADLASRGNAIYHPTVPS